MQLQGGTPDSAGCLPPKPPSTWLQLKHTAKAHQEGTALLCVCVCVSLCVYLFIGTDLLRALMACGAAH